MIELILIVFLIYNFRALWSVAKFRPERSIGCRWQWFYGKENENHWLYRYYPDLFQRYQRNRHLSDFTNTLDAFHIFQGAMNYVILNALLMYNYGLGASLWITPIVFVILESMLFNPLFHWVYTMPEFRDLWRSSPWKFILYSPEKGKKG